jgi:AcrR family transcriptional regulator
MPEDLSQPPNTDVPDEHFPRPFAPPRPQIPQPPEATVPDLRRRNRERAREDIGRAARRLFARHGYARTSVEEVARAAGVSLRTVFRHFAHKRDLVFFEHERDVERLRELLAAADPDRDSLSCLLEAVRTLYVPAVPDPDGPALMALMDSEPELRRHAIELASDHERTVREFLVARGGEGAGERRRAALLAGATMGMLDAARRLSYAPESAGAERHLREAEELLRRLPFPP